jgi:uncharacterized protein (TIGR03084 family)
MADSAAVIADLLAEGAELDARVASLPDADWRVRTPAAGWTVAHQIAHLAWTDEKSLRAVADPAAFAAALAAAVDSGQAGLGSVVDAAAATGAALSPADLLARWRQGRSALAHALQQVPDGTRISWFGPPMSATSMATARLMETWAHGGDVAAALGQVQQPSERIRHIVHLAVRTRDFAFRLHGQPHRPSRCASNCGPPAASRGCTDRTARHPRSPVRRGTSRCWPPSGSTARTRRSPRTPRRLTGGSTSSRPSPVPPARAVPRGRRPRRHERVVGARPAHR